MTASIRTTYTDGTSFQQVHAGGEWRRLVHIEPPRGTFVTLDRGEIPLIPESQWETVDWSHFVVGVKDQGQLGSCLPNAITGAYEDAMNMAGLTPRRLCAEQLYGQVAWPSDNGSTFEETLVKATTVGMVPEALVPAGRWDPRTWPAEWAEVAKKFKVKEIFDCPTAQHVCTAIQRGFQLPFGVSVTNAFEPDSAGVIHPYKIGQLNHGVRGVGMKKIDGDWYIDMVNSWNARWGVNGHAWFPVRSLPSRVPAWAIRVGVYPSDDPMWRK